MALYHCSAYSELESSPQTNVFNFLSPEDLAIGVNSNAVRPRFLPSLKLRLL